MFFFLANRSCKKAKNSHVCHVLGADCLGDECDTPKVVRRRMQVQGCVHGQSKQLNLSMTLEELWKMLFWLDSLRVRVLYTYYT